MKKSLFIVVLVLMLCACIFVGCQQPCTEHVDANNDGVCDKCGAEVTKEPVYSVDITSGNASIYEGETLQLTATKTPEDAVITWTTSDDSIATVENGLVTAVKAGTATISATVKDGVSDNIVITVLPYSVSIDNKDVTEIKIGETLTLTATKAPATATVTWTSSDETVATVVDGVVTGIKDGRVTVTASVKEGVADTIEIEVVSSVSITNKDVTEIYEGQTLDLNVIASPADAELTWTSSDESIATIEDNKVITHKAGTVTITVSIKDGVSDNIVITVLPYSVSIDNKDVTEIKIGETLTLTATKAPATATVTWTSSDETVATVVDGVVTGIKDGRVTVTASVKEGVADTIEIEVVSSVSITNKDVTEIYEGQTLDLNVIASPADAELTWTSSDESIATIEDNKVITHKAGTVTITVSIKDGVSDSIELTVKPTIANANINPGKFDFSGMYSEDPVIKSSGAVNSFAVLNGEAGRYYIVSVMVKVTDPDAGDTWSRVGVSHFNGNNSYYGFQLSAGPNFNARKTVTMVITDGSVEWGIVTDRSQVWNQHNLANIDFNAVKITVVRNGNDFYAYLNDQLYYVDNGMENFDNIDTVPVLNVGSCAAEFSDISVSYSQEDVDAYLQTADDSLFYASYGDTIIGEDGTITFTGAAEGTCSTNAKDHAAKFMGTSSVLDANVQSTVEFDLTVNCFGSRDAMPALAVTINRYDSQASEARSVVIAQYKTGFAGWNSNGDLNAGIPSNEGGVAYSVDGSAARLEEGETYHVVMTRLMNNGQDLKLKIVDKDGNVLAEFAHGWNDGYTGRAVVSLLSRDVDCVISNLVISSEQA